MCQIAIVEDQAIIRTGLYSILIQEPQFNIISQARNPFDLFQEVWPVIPDLVLLGSIMPKMNGVEAIENIRRRWHCTKILVYTYKEEGNGIAEAFQAGADAYLLKEASREDLIAAIKKISAGHYYDSDNVLLRNMNKYILAEKMLSADKLNTVLTAREGELFKLIVEGFKNKEIADNLCISLKTVETHRTNLMKKLHVHNVAELISVAEIAGIANHSAERQFQPNFV